jgi:6-phosphofructokinase
MEDKHFIITEESYATFRNLGGYDYCGRTHDMLRTNAHLTKAAEFVKKHNITGLVVVGATHSLTDSVALAEYFLENAITTRVISIPASVDGNIRH